MGEFYSVAWGFVLGDLRGCCLAFPGVNPEQCDSSCFFGYVMKTHANFTGCPRKQPRLTKTYTAYTARSSSRVQAKQAIQAQETAIETRNMATTVDSFLEQETLYSPDMHSL